MLYYRDHPEQMKHNRIKDIAQYKSVSNKSIALVGLLHDLGKMDCKGLIKVTRGHEVRSRMLVEKFLEDAGLHEWEKVLAAIYYHHRRSKHDIRLVKHKGSLLLELLRSADSAASGTAWNSTRFKEGWTQHKGASSHSGYLRAEALDRTMQCLDYHFYLDNRYEMHTIRGYSLDRIEWNTREEVVSKLKESVVEDEEDLITELREMDRGDKGFCLVVGIDPSVSSKPCDRLRDKWRHEQNLLICSNLLNEMYVHKSIGYDHRYEFTLHNSMIPLYQQQEKGKGIFLPGVTFFRDGERNGFQMVAPWQCDVLLVPGMKGQGWLKGFCLAEKRGEKR